MIHVLEVSRLDHNIWRENDIQMMIAVYMNVKTINRFLLRIDNIMAFLNNLNVIYITLLIMVLNFHIRFILLIIIWETLVSH